MPINQSVVQIQTKKQAGYDQISLKTNVVIASYITSLARTEMHKSIIKCDNSKINIFYMDTDSLIIARDKNVGLPLELSGSLFGKFKLEINDEILAFYSLG